MSKISKGWPPPCPQILCTVYHTSCTVHPPHHVPSASCSHSHTERWQAAPPMHPKFHPITVLKIRPSYHKCSKCSLHHVPKSSAPCTPCIVILCIHATCIQLHTERWLAAILIPFQILNSIQFLYWKLGLLIIKVTKAPLHQVPEF